MNRPDYETVIQTILMLLARKRQRVCDFWSHLELCNFNIRCSDDPSVHWTVVAKPLRDLLKAGTIRRVSRGLYELAH
jgi:hypothetical protein